MKITNNSTRTLDYLEKGGKVTNGVPATVSIEAGQTADLNVDPEDVQVRAAILTGLISVPESVEKAVVAEVAGEPRATGKK